MYSTLGLENMGFDFNASAFCRTKPIRLLVIINRMTTLQNALWFLLRITVPVLQCSTVFSITLVALYLFLNLSVIIINLP